MLSTRRPTICPATIRSARPAANRQRRPFLPRRVNREPALRKRQPPPPLRQGSRSVSARRNATADRAAAVHRDSHRNRRKDSARSFAHRPAVRKVIEEAVAAGLEVEIAGSGSVREQAPLAELWSRREPRSWFAAGDRAFANNEPVYIPFGEVRVLLWTRRSPAGSSGSKESSATRSRWP